MTKKMKPSKQPESVPVDDTLRQARQLPMFGPGLVVRVPLQLWPAYQQLYGLQVLPPQRPAHERIQQQVVLVKRVPGSREQGSVLLELAFWTGLVLFVLFCLLGGRPW